MIDPNQKPKFKHVAIFGFAEGRPGELLYETVFEAAKYLAERNYVIINGGGPGVMAAATKGAESVNGETLTITFSPKEATGFEGRYVGNVPDVEIQTGNYIERMFKLMEHGDMYVIFNGGTGTLSEFATAWVLAKLYKGRHKPFILFGDFWFPIVEVLEKHMHIRAGSKDVFRIVTNNEEMMRAIEEFEEEFKNIDNSDIAESEERAFMT